MKILIISFFLTFILFGSNYALAQDAPNKSIWQNAKAQVLELFNEVFIAVEKYRLQKAEYFSKERDMMKKVLKINGHSEFMNNETNLSYGDLDDPRIKDKIEMGNPMDYVLYIIYIPLATFFSDKLVFYTFIILVFLLITRFISKISFKWYS